MRPVGCRGLGAKALQVSNHSAYDQKQQELLKLSFSGTEMMLPMLRWPFFARIKLSSAGLLSGVGNSTRACQAPLYRGLYLRLINLPT